MLANNRRQILKKYLYDLLAADQTAFRVFKRQPPLDTTQKPYVWLDASGQESLTFERAEDGAIDRVSTRATYSVFCTYETKKDLAGLGTIDDKAGDVIELLEQALFVHLENPADPFVTATGTVWVKDVLPVGNVIANDDEACEGSLMVTVEITAELYYT